jgi:hypothetical protein
MSDHLLTILHILGQGHIRVNELVVAVDERIAYVPSLTGSKACNLAALNTDRVADNQNMAESYRNWKIEINGKMVYRQGGKSGRKADGPWDCKANDRNG